LRENKRKKGGKKQRRQKLQKGGGKNEGKMGEREKRINEWRNKEGNVTEIVKNSTHFKLYVKVKVRLSLLHTHTHTHTPRRHIYRFLCYLIGELTKIFCTTGVSSLQHDQMHFQPLKLLKPNFIQTLSKLVLG
jgi:hypothetical protein